MPVRLLLSFVALAATWGASFLFMRLGAADFGPIPTASMRVTLAAVFLLPALLIPAIRRDFTKRAGHILFVGLLNSGVPFAFFAFAVMHISTSLTAILNATVPLTGAIVAWAWLHERPDNSRILGLLIGLLGVVLLVSARSSGAIGPGQGGDEHPWLPLLSMAACIAATVCYAFAASFTKKYLQGIHPLSTTTGSLIGASLGLAIPAYLTWPAVTPSANAWAAIAAVAILCTSLAYILFFHIINTAGPAKALTVTFLVPVFALFYGVTFLKEQITPWMVICGLVIVSGTVLATGLWKIQALNRRNAAA